MSNALVLFGKIFGGAAKMTNYLRAAAASPADFINVGKINQAEGYRLREEAGFPQNISNSLVAENNAAFYLHENELLRVNSPIERPPLNLVSNSYVDSFARATRWAANQLNNCVAWLMNKICSASAKTFIVVAGTIVISAFAGYFTFYYKAPRPSAPLPPPNVNEEASAVNNTVDLSANSQLVDGHDEDTMLCLVCLERSRTHIFIPCGHMLTCAEHSKPFMNKKCPVCRTDVTYITKVTLA